MNVSIYVVGVTLMGAGIAYGVGRAMRNLNSVAAAIAFLVVSVGLGILLAFPLLVSVGSLCSFHGLTDRQCIRTDDHTVWLLIAPLVAFPAYLASMFVGRAIAKVRRLSKREIGIVATFLLAPPFAFFAWLYIANTEQITKAADARHTRAARLNELCETAVHVDIRRTAARARSVLFPMIANATYSMLENLDFVEVGRSYRKPGTASYERIRKKPNEPLFVRGVPNVIREEVANAESEYEVSVRPIESKADTAIGLFVEQTTIINRRTNDVLAVFTSAGERRSMPGGGSRFCPSGFDYVRYQREIPSYVLGLMDENASKDFAKRLATMHKAAAAAK